MKNTYKIVWTENALKELDWAYQYLSQNWTEKEMKNLSIEIEKTIQLLSSNPYLFPISEFKNIRRIIIKTFNTMYYRINDGKDIEIISFFSNRQNPDRRKYK